MRIREIYLISGGTGILDERVEVVPIPSEVSVAAIVFVAQEYRTKHLRQGVQNRAKIGNEGNSQKVPFLSVGQRLKTTFPDYIW
jgi:hypothetical protein